MFLSLQQRNHQSADEPCCSKACVELGRDQLRCWCQTRVRKYWLFVLASSRLFTLTWKSFVEGANNCNRHYINKIRNYTFWFLRKGLMPAIYCLHKPLCVYISNVGSDSCSGFHCGLSVARLASHHTSRSQWLLWGGQALRLHILPVSNVGKLERPLAVLCEKPHNETDTELSFSASLLSLIEASECCCFFLPFDGTKSSLLAS